MSFVRAHPQSTEHRATGIRRKPCLCVYIKHRASEKLLLQSYLSFVEQARCNKLQHQIKLTQILKVNLIYARHPDSCDVMLTLHTSAIMQK